MTGATGGLGQPIVRYLADSGCYIIFAAGTNEQKLAQLSEIKNVIPVKIDILDSDSIASVHQYIQSKARSSETC